MLSSLLKEALSMYSNKENVNILTALLLSHHVRHAVVCPGSRNAPIVHNLHLTPDITCHPVTDERSAAFYALGIAQATGEKVLVCVTSGTALLNLMPGVAEAAYQHLPVIVVSADRPSAWINQQDGQTLPQPHALEPFVRLAVNLPEPHDDTTRWQCNRLVNQALLQATASQPAPVHINIPISEPLFRFTVPSLPSQRHITLIPSSHDSSAIRDLLFPCLCQARRPLLVIGQMPPRSLPQQAVKSLARHIVLLREALSPPVVPLTHVDEALMLIADDPDYVPDFVLYVGGTIVSKRLKQFLRGSAADARQWAVNQDGDIYDTFGHLTGVVTATPAEVLSQLATLLSDTQTGRAPSHGMSETPCQQTVQAGHSHVTAPFVERWQAVLSRAARLAQDFQPAFSQMAVVRHLETCLSSHQGTVHVHYANSMAVRLANVYATSHVFCNRGVNGIEGSLSAACGFSLVAPGLTFCVIGDLSFFYDQNALWNQNLPGNLRIVLLNNGGGAIFKGLQGLNESEACEALVGGAHLTTAEGICRQNGLDYLCARNMEEVARGVSALLDGNAPSASSSSVHRRGMLLEVFTNRDDDWRVYGEDYLRFVGQL